MKSRSQTQVLIVGAGPTGLVMALILNKLKVPFAIVDSAPGPGTASRAMVVQARTLELYNQLEFDQEVVDRGIRVTHLEIVRDGKPAALLDLENFGAGLSPYPYALSFPQDEHEKVLVDKLSRAGVAVRRNCRLASMRRTDKGVLCSIENGASSEEIEAVYVVGADGAHSTVRHLLNIGFEGGTYDQVMFVADVDLPDGPKDRLQGHFGNKSFCAVFPIRTSGMCRLIGVVPETIEDPAAATYGDIRTVIESWMATALPAQPNWFSIYKVHHRVAERFRDGRAFICGDAAHIHSPAGGQGMNTGIGDSANLAWKLAHVLQRGASDALLDTYEAERKRFALGLIESTDRAFGAATSAGFGSEALRNFIVSEVLPNALRLGGVRRAAFRLISQIGIEYRESPLSVGGVGTLRGGDRLPWVSSLDNFHPLKSFDWQVHLYGDESLQGEVDLPLQRFGFCSEAADAGLTENAFYVVRPDGYIADAGKRSDWIKAKEKLNSFGYTSGSSGL